MLEYVFFDTRPRDRFVHYLNENQVTFEAQENIDSLSIFVSENLDESLADKIENFYDDMMAYNQSLVESEQNSSNDSDFHSAGVVLNLKDGITSYAQVNPILLGRIMEVLTPQEFGEVVNAIVDAVETPDQRSMCQWMRDGVNKQP